MISKEILEIFAKEYHKEIGYCGYARLSNGLDGILCILRYGRWNELPEKWEYAGQKFVIEAKFDLSNDEDDREKTIRRRNALSRTAHDADRRKKVRPLAGGISLENGKASTGIDDSRTGTLGLIVRSMNNAPSGPVGDVILSCDHVIEESNLFQPGSYDNGGNKSDCVSKWTASSKNKYNSLKDKTVDGLFLDAAIAKPEVEILLAPYQIFIKSGKTISLNGTYAYKKIKIGTLVSKAGRATGITSGMVVSKAFYKVDQAGGKLKEGAILIKGNSRITDFAVTSDSGSIVWETGTRQVVGLLWGATLYREHPGPGPILSMAFVAPIEPICEAFNLTMSAEGVKKSEVR